jgi:hypothetical protein
MSHRTLSSFLGCGALAVAIAAVLLAPERAAAQAPVKALAIWSQPRTADGQPDLQGIWSNATITPLERPNDLAGKQFFSEQEAADYERQVIQRNNKDRRDGAPEADVGRAYNDFWWDTGTHVVKTRRTSLVTDPSDGRIPALTPEAQKRAAARAEARRQHPADGPENRPLMERCLQIGSAGPPMLPSAYNNNYQIVQTPGYVTIFNEMIHDVRVIPLDGRPHLPPNLRLWLGDSRGHWEGNTLVIDTTNFTDKTAFRGSSENLHLIERFTRTDRDTLLYEFTVDDPTSFTRPWSAAIPSVKFEGGPLLEYACNEGNRGMEGILAGARAAEKIAAK